MKNKSLLSRVQTPAFIVNSWVGLTLILPRIFYITTSRPSTHNQMERKTTINMVINGKLLKDVIQRAKLEGFDNELYEFCRKLIAERLIQLKGGKINGR